MVVSKGGAARGPQPEQSITAMQPFQSFAARPKAAVRFTHPVRARELAELAEASGCRILTDETGPEPPAEADFILADFSSETNLSEEDWRAICSYLHGCEAELLVWTDFDGLDAAYAALPQQRCHFLVDTRDWQAVPILSGAFRRGAMDQFHDLTRDSEMGALHRISNELADFARTLARIAEQDASPGSHVSDKPIGFRPAPAGLLQPATVERGRRPNAADIREIIKLRRLRDRFFDPELFADPGWDIMLDLYAADGEEQRVSVSSLCIAAAVPPTTALRWITNMTERGLLVRRQDPDDARRVFIELAETTRAQLDGYFEACSVRRLVPL